MRLRVDIRRILPFLGAVSMALVGFLATAQDSNSDAAYIAKFREKYKETVPPPTLAEYATAARYDREFMGDALEKAKRRVVEDANDNGGMAWGFAARMISLNEMYRATGDPKYLTANLDCARTALAATDEKRGKQLWTGKSTPIWGCDKYAPERGRAAFAVHTGMITYGILDCLLLVRENRELRSALGSEFDVFLRDALRSVAYHDPQWHDGPGKGEGSYFGKDQEPVCEGKPLPGNRLSAMGRSLWTVWKLTGDKAYRDRALALGWYIKNRLTPAPDGAYYWPYWLPETAVTEPQPREALKGEDSSHAGLTIAFPLMLAEDHRVFSRRDLKRLAKTALNGFGRLNDGVLLPTITGATNLDPDYVGSVARWMTLARYDDEVKARLLAFYLRHVSSPGPYDLALLLRYGS